MQAGDKIKCTGSRGCMLTTNKVYTVVDYQPSAHVDHFTWPAYVAVVDDHGQKVWCHANRFIKEQP